MFNTFFAGCTIDSQAYLKQKNVKEKYDELNLTKLSSFVHLSRDTAFNQQFTHHNCSCEKQIKKNNNSRFKLTE